MKLTDTQLVMLSRASQRDDRGVEIPATLAGAAAERTVRSLLDKGLVERTPRIGDLPLWSTDSDGSPLALAITAKGLEAIGVDPEGMSPQDGKGSPDRTSARPLRRRSKTAPTMTKATDRAPTPKAGTARHRSARPPRKSASPRGTRKAEPRHGEPRPQSKLGQVLAMLRRPKGATVADLAAATGWQRHTVRAALTGLRKRGLAVNRAKDTRGTSVYRIAKG